MICKTLWEPPKRNPTLASKNMKPTQTPVWKHLQAHFHEIKALHLRELFALDPDRATRLTHQAAGWRLDLSKNRLTQETLDLLLELARTMDVPGRAHAMFRGEKINKTENFYH